MKRRQIFIELTSLLDPAGFTGMAAHQCRHFLEERVKPLLAENQDSLGAAAEIRV